MRQLESLWIGMALLSFESLELQPEHGRIEKDSHLKQAMAFGVTIIVDKGLGAFNDS